MSRAESVWYDSQASVYAFKVASSFESSAISIAQFIVKFILNHKVPYQSRFYDQVNDINIFFVKRPEVGSPVSAGSIVFVQWSTQAEFTFSTGQSLSRPGPGIIEQCDLQLFQLSCIYFLLTVALFVLGKSKWMLANKTKPSQFSPAQHNVQ